MMPEVGATYHLAEADYQFGTGPLLARVTGVIRETVYNGEPWFEVQAMCKPPNTVGPAHLRQLYLKGSSLGGARRTRP